MATYQLPEWESPASGAPRASLFSRANPFTRLSTSGRPSFFSTRKSPFSSGAAAASGVETNEKEAVRPHSEEVQAPAGGRRRYCGYRKQTCIILFVLIICLLGLIIGLAIGLKGKHHKAANLPLPSNKATFSGDLTYYSPGPGYGACGYENTSTDSICAVSHIIWDAASTSSNPNNNPLCGKKIRITRYDAAKGGNHSVDVEVVDRCVGCVAVDLDLSLKMFTTLAEEAEGRVTGSWAWLD